MSLNRDELMKAYPDACEDERGTIWTSKDAVYAVMDEDFNVDANIEDALGWSWDDAVENFAECKRIAILQARRIRFARLYAVRDFICHRWRFVCTFCNLLGREIGYYPGRFGPKLSWTIAKTIWLR